MCSYLLTLDDVAGTRELMPSRAALPAPGGLVGHPRPLLRCCRAASARLGRCLYDYAGRCVIVRPAVPRLPRAVRCSRSAGPRPPAPGSVLAHVGPGACANRQLGPLR